MFEGEESVIRLTSRCDERLSIIATLDYMHLPHLSCICNERSVLSALLEHA